MTYFLSITYLMVAILTYGLVRGTDLKQFPTIHYKLDIPIALAFAFLSPLGLAGFFIAILILNDWKYVCIRLRK